MRTQWLAFLLVLAVRLPLPAESPKAQDPKRIEQLIEKLGSSSFKEREQAEKDLVAVGSMALRKLELATKSPDKEMARRAKAASAEIKRLIREATFVDTPRHPDLNDLKSSNVYTRIRAVTQLAHLGPGAKETLPHVLRALDDSEDQVRIAAISALCTQGADPKLVLPKMLAIMRDGTQSVDVRVTAMSALKDFTPLIALTHGFCYRRRLVASTRCYPNAVEPLGRTQQADQVEPAGESPGAMGTGLPPSPPGLPAACTDSRMQTCHAPIPWSPGGASSRSVTFCGEAT